MKMLNGYTIFFALQYVFQTSGQMKFTSPYQGKNVTGLVGSSVSFTWSYSGGTNGVEEIAWGIKKDSADEFIAGGVLASRKTQTGNPVPVQVPADYAGRVNGSFSGDSSSGQVIFTLTSIKKRDQRVYGCALDSISNFEYEVFDFVNLVVQEPPTIAYPTAANATYNFGSPVNISCAATGIPDPDVKWINNGEVKSSGVKKADLTFWRIRKADAGMYTCTANNSVGNEEKQLKLIVKYQATIHNISSSVSKSWIGQTVALICESDGLPTPTLSWYKPDGTKFNQVKAEENTVVVTMNSDKDFGLYNCTADNSFKLASKTVRVKQIKAPGLPIITVDIQATSLTVKWTAPADDGGSPITAYRVVILRGDTEIAMENVTGPATTTWSFGGLNKNTNYILKVYARNYVFEGNFSQKAVQTKLEGIPEAAFIMDLPAKTKNVEVIVKWDEPQSNGAPITQYTVYQRTVDDGGLPQEWIKIHVITDISVREIAVKLEKGHDYEIVVTASNKFGESLKEEKKIKKISVLGDVPTAVETTDDIILKWKEPNDNGAAISQYSIYQRFINDEQWRKAGSITDVYKHEYVVDIEKGKEYEFVVTATNKYGESSKEETIKRIKVLEVFKKQPGNKAGSVRDDKGLLHGVYVSVVLLLSIVIFILFVVLCKMRRRLEIVHSSRKRVKREEPIAMKPMAEEVEPATQPSSAMQQDDALTYEIPGGEDYMPLHPSGRSWEISREGVRVIKVIGKGAFSEVAKATLWNLKDNEYITVAAKMLKANAPASDRKDLLSELELMKKLKPHNHVIKLIGCVTESEPLLVLIEYVPFGDLLGYLRKSRGLNDTYFKDPDVKPQTSLTAGQLMKFAWQVADGMCYLSSKKIIHRDLAARNVLVGEGETCKVTDFGMARNLHQDDIYARKSRGRLPVKWTAYEALLYGIYTTQSDVWSYGILLYEILTVGGSPYPDIIPRQITERLQEGYRMPKPKHVDDKLYQLMLKCWEEQPTDRPTFDKLKKTMKEMERKHKTYVNLSQYDNSLYANVNDLTEEEITS